MKTFSIILFLGIFVCPFAHAAGGGDGVPWEIVFKQVINFSLFVGLLFWILRDKVKSYFKNKAEDYQKQREESLKVIKNAEKQFQEIKEDLEKLRQNRKADLLQSQENAEKLKDQILSEGHQTVIKLTEEVKKTIRMETERVKIQMREYAVSRLMIATRKHLTKEMSPLNHKLLQDEFIEKVKS